MQTDVVQAAARIREHESRAVFRAWALGRVFPRPRAVLKRSRKGTLLVSSVRYDNSFHLPDVTTSTSSPSDRQATPRPVQSMRLSRTLHFAWPVTTRTRARVNTSNGCRYRAFAEPVIDAVRLARSTTATGEKAGSGLLSLPSTRTKLLPFGTRARKLELKRASVSLALGYAICIACSPAHRRGLPRRPRKSPCPRPCRSPLPSAFARTPSSLYPQSACVLVRCPQRCRTERLNWPCVPRTMFGASCTSATHRPGPCVGQNEVVAFT